MAKTGQNCSSSCACSANSTSDAAARRSRYAAYARRGRGSSGLLLALGVAGGLAGGLALAKKLSQTASATPEVSGLDIWQRELAKTSGTVAAGFLCAQVQAHFVDLYRDRPRFANGALRDHLEKNILPGLALYQTLKKEFADATQTLAEFDRLEAATILASPLATKAQMLSMFPDPFAVFRFIHNQTLDKQYPPEGWRFEWVEDSPEVIAYNCTDCFYHNILTRYGFPELTAHFCRLDDVMFDRFSSIAWKRTMTIGRGDAYCNFRFEKKVSLEKN